MLNTSDSRLNKIAWVNAEYDLRKFSNLQLQKFLFFYEMFQFLEDKDYDFSSLKAYKNGPVFSNFYGDITYREREVYDYLDNHMLDENAIDIDNANLSMFLIRTLTDSELSELSHQLNMWSIHEEKINKGERKIVMKESDITDGDIELLNLIKADKPSYSYGILKVGNKRFVYPQEQGFLQRLTDEHLEFLESLSDSSELFNPIYIEFDEVGGLLLD